MPPCRPPKFARRARLQQSVVAVAVAVSVFGTTACDSFDFGRVFGRTSTAPSASASSGLGASASSAPAPMRPDRVVVIVGGDVVLSGNTTSFIAADKNYDPLSGLRAVLDGPGLRVASLLSPIGDRAAPPGEGKDAPHAAPKRSADALARASLDALFVANRELSSSDDAAFSDTVANLRRAKIAPAGLATSEKPFGGAELVVSGFSVSLFAVTAWPPGDPTPMNRRSRVAAADTQGLVSAIRRARPHHDLVLVGYHGGAEFSETASGDEVSFAHAVVAAGADAVFFTGGHVPSGVAWISERPVFYGLGNLIAEEDSKHPWSGRGYVARVTFSRHSPAVVDACPFIIEDSEPKLLSGSSRPTQEGVFARTIARLSVPYGGAVVGEPDLHSCVRLTAPPRPGDNSAPP